ncbi:MAG TPA: hypothetical protein DD628_04005 [Clostridiales bacterium]|nr:hypothetical protein [Candidatus Apopatosoma intestinale]CCZ20842.1 putative uncharacterized protein [Candidatus Apopatosoma intestinale]HBO65826.1 hypothetical protein [Candidatus Apopatosoma intestinale]
MQMKLAVAIPRRGYGNAASEVCREYGAALPMIVRGHGTASSDIMNMFGLDEPEKDVVLCVTDGKTAPLLLEGFNKKLHFEKPGAGIAFALPLSGISRAVSEMVSTANDSAEKENTAVADEKKEEETKMETNAEIKHYELIIVATSSGNTDIAVKAAKEAGVRGGTVLRAREAELGKKIFGITVQPEKEIVFMLVRAEMRQDVMKAICAAVLNETGEHALTFSLPVSDVIGLHKDNGEDKAEKAEEK